MDVYQILIQDHRTIAKMFKEISGTSNKDPERRKQLFSDLWTALEDHETTEENDFLPVLVEASSFSSDAGVTATYKGISRRALRRPLRLRGHFSANLAPVDQQ